ncbi:TPA: hypothetical protein VM634_001320 [Streptococcus pyogenes]|nr:hypothetical protein [Streptococcus pyogenes]
MIRKYDRTSTKKKSLNWIWLIIAFFMISSFIGGSSFTESLLDILPAIAIGGTGYAIFRVRSHQKRLAKAKIAKQLEDLKAKIQLADRKVRLLDTYLADHDDFQYNVLAQQLLPQLSDTKAKAITLKDQLDPQIYRRITKKANDVESDITLQLETLQIATTLNPQPLKTPSPNLINKAPELKPYYDNIQTDHQAILAKIQGADNQEELLALHDANMRRFEDILTGYLKIKEEPKNYYNAAARLEQAKQAIQQFDEDLDETLRRLNESDLKDFDISLRIMQGATQRRTTHHQKD